jgi:hypothetical protein
LRADTHLHHDSVAHSTDRRIRRVTGIATTTPHSVSHVDTGAMQTVLQWCADAAALTESGDHVAAAATNTRAVDAAPTLLDLHLLRANAQRLAGGELAARDSLQHAQHHAQMLQTNFDSARRCWVRAQQLKPCSAFVARANCDHAMASPLRQSQRNCETRDARAKRGAKLRRRWC